jgi:hypothetical protein
MEHHRKIVFIGIGGAERPIMRNGHVQDFPELFRDNRSHLLDILRIAKIPSHGRYNQAEKGNGGSQGDVSA